jgi:FMN phosphatase YigB (HAD superfamily)
VDFSSQTPFTRRFAVYEVITFDCYGTLIDWEGGISSATSDAAALAGVDVD